MLLPWSRTVSSDNHMLPRLRMIKATCFCYVIRRPKCTYRMPPSFSHQLHFRNIMDDLSIYDIGSYVRPVPFRNVLLLFGLSLLQHYAFCFTGFSLFPWFTASFLIDRTLLYHYHTTQSIFKSARRSVEVTLDTSTIRILRLLFRPSYTRSTSPNLTPCLLK
jgi:hypothetical protein